MHRSNDADHQIGSTDHRISHITFSKTHRTGTVLGDQHRRPSSKSHLRVYNWFFFQSQLVETHEKEKRRSLVYHQYSAHPSGRAIPLCERVNINCVQQILE